MRTYSKSAKKWVVRSPNERELNEGIVVQMEAAPGREFFLQLVGTVNETISGTKGRKLAADGSPAKSFDTYDPMEEQTVDLMIMARFPDHQWSTLGTTTEFKWHWLLKSEKDDFVNEICQLLHPYGYCAFGICSVD